MGTSPRPANAIAGLGKRYGSFDAVSSLTLAVQPGEVFGFLGPNGAGKTTTIRMLMGILVPTAEPRGPIAGLDCQGQRAEVKSEVGYLPDNPIFYDYLRGREVLEFVGEMHGLPRRTARRRAGALLESLALADAAEEFAINYSMGMKKKLGLACALMHEPSVLILDEPTNGLDPLAAREVRQLLLNAAGAGKSSSSCRPTFWIWRSACARASGSFTAAGWSRWARFLTCARSWRQADRSRRSSSR